MYYIYALIDPSSGVLCYIGLTKNPSQRLADHLSDMRPSPRKRWIDELVGSGKIPILKILEETNSKMKAHRLEAELIREHSKVGGLLNRASNNAPAQDVREIRRKNKVMQRDLDPVVRLHNCWYVVMEKGKARPIFINSLDFQKAIRKKSASRSILASGTATTHQEARKQAFKWLSQNKAW